MQASGSGSAWLEHQTGGLGIAGSNPVFPTICTQSTFEKKVLFLFWDSLRKNLW